MLSLPVRGELNIGHRHKLANIAFLFPQRLLAPPDLILLAALLSMTNAPQPNIELPIADSADVDISSWPLVASNSQNFRLLDIQQFLSLHLQLLPLRGAGI